MSESAHAAPDNPGYGCLARRADRLGPRLGVPDLEDHCGVLRHVSPRQSENEEILSGEEEAQARARRFCRHQLSMKSTCSAFLLLQSSSLGLRGDEADWRLDDLPDAADPCPGRPRGRLSAVRRDRSSSVEPVTPVSSCCVFAPIRRPRSLDPASCRMKCTSSASKPRKVSLATRTTRSGNVGYTSRISPSAARS